MTRDGKRTNRPEPDRTLLITAGSKPPSGHRVEFAGGYADPPAVGSWLLLSHGDRQTVAASGMRSTQKGSGAAASNSVLDSLGCAPTAETQVGYRAARFKDWLRHGPNAKLRLAALIAGFVVALGGFAKGLVAVFDEGSEATIAVGAIAAIILAAETVAVLVRLKSIKNASSD